jgi:hypothetical protein
MSTVSTSGFGSYAAARLRRAIFLFFVVSQVLLWGIAGVEAATPAGQSHAKFQCNMQSRPVEMRRGPEWWQRPSFVEWSQRPLPPFC